MIRKFKKIYILTPQETIAGGVESLFQLADAINSFENKAIILFNGDNLKDPVPEKYAHYKSGWQNISSFEDHEDNLIIVPEIWTPHLQKIHNAQKSIWWLSVDHNYGKFQDFSRTDILHFCQSCYSDFFLKLNGNFNTLPLNDYVELEKKLNHQKQNIVCYNPAKGKEVTLSVIESNKDINFIALDQMTKEQVIEHLSKSKIYIDLGNHPGRDRFPREAALLDNCIITNKQGSARYFDDVPINEEYKVEDFSQIGSKIKYIFEYFEEKTIDFEFYRKVISRQKEDLFRLVQSYFI